VVLGGSVVDVVVGIDVVAGSVVVVLGSSVVVVVELDEVVVVLDEVVVVGSTVVVVDEGVVVDDVVGVEELCQADAADGNNANSKAGIGISHRVKFCFTSVPCSEY
jgi:hypothetical protein